MWMFEIFLDPNNYPFWILLIAIILGTIGIISRPFSTYIKFVYPNAKFEAMGNPYTNEKKLESLSEVKNLNNFKENINDSKDYNIEGDNTFTIQQSLDKSFLSFIDMMKKDSSKKMYPFYDNYLEKQDLLIIRNTIKKLLLNEKLDKIEGQGFLPKTRKLLLDLKEAEKKDISPILENYGLSPELINIISQNEIDFFKLDIEFDRYIFTKLKTLKVPYKCEEGKQLFLKILLDISNLKNILRAKQSNYDSDKIKLLFLDEGSEIPQWKFNELAQKESISRFISGLEGTSYYDVLTDEIETYNKEQSTQIFEIALDKLFLKRTAEISNHNYTTIGPSIRFLISKEYEIRNLKIIAKGIGENLSPEIFRQYLVTEVGN